MKPKRLATVVGLGIAMASCGGDGGATGPGASGLEKSRTWSRLTTAEIDTTCAVGTFAPSCAPLVACFK